MLLNTNLTTLPIDEITDTVKNETLKDSNTASETLLKPIYLNTNDTKIDQIDDKLINLFTNTNSTSTSTKEDKMNNQTNSTENKHIALESDTIDEYGEEDMSGYSAIFTGQLTYNYAKAEREIKSKKFDLDVEQKVIEYHENCKEEAQDKFNNPIQIIGQIQLYQACME